MRVNTRLKERLDALRATTARPWILRGVILGSGVAMVLLAAWLCRLGPLGWVLGAVAVAGVLWAFAVPEAVGGMVAILAVAVWWWFRGVDLPWASAIPVSLCALAFHQTSAWAAALPLHAEVDPAAGRGLAVRLGTLLVGGAAAGVLVGVVAGLPVPGVLPWSIAAVVALVSVVAGLVVVRDAGRGTPTPTDPRP